MKNFSAPRKTMNLKSAILLLIFCAYGMEIKVATEKKTVAKQESVQKEFVDHGEAVHILRKFKIHELYEPTKLLSDVHAVDRLRTKLILEHGSLRFKFSCGAYVPWNGEEFPLKFSYKGKVFRLNSAKLLTSRSPFDVLSIEVLGGETSCEIIYKNNSYTIVLRLAHQKMPLEERIISRLEKNPNVSSKMDDITLRAFFNEKEIGLKYLLSNAKFLDVKTLQKMWENSDRAVTQGIAKKNARVRKIVRGTAVVVFAVMYALLYTAVPSYDDIKWYFRSKDGLDPETFYLLSTLGTSFISACISFIFYLWYPPLHKYFSKF